MLRRRGSLETPHRLASRSYSCLAKRASRCCARLQKTAFKALPRHFLGLLWDDLCRDTDARKHTTEFDLCFQLVKKVLPHLSNADTFELVGTRGLKKNPEFDTFIAEDNLAHIARGVDEEVTLEIQEKLVEKKRAPKTRATPTTTTHRAQRQFRKQCASRASESEYRACCLHSRTRKAVAPQAQGLRPGVPLPVWLQTRGRITRR